MRQIFTAFAVVVALSAAATVLAQTTHPAGKTAQAAAPAKKIASHSTSGTVKSIDSTTLVITHGKKDMTFSVNSSTQKEGSVDTGSHVTVRYTMDGKNMVATAITGQAAKPVASKTTSKPASK